MVMSTDATLTPWQCVKIRKSTGLSLDDFAKAYGFTRPSLAAYEDRPNHTHRYPKGEDLTYYHKLIDIFHIDITEPKGNENEPNF